MMTPQQLFEEYIQLRRNGLDAPTVLQHLRGRIELLSANDRAEVVKQVKIWEGHQTNPIRSNQSNTSGQIKPISPKGKTDSTPSLRKAVQQHAPAFTNQPTASSQGAWPLACPNCGKMNDASAVFCYSCGFVLQAQQSAFSTVPLSSMDSPQHDDSYFGPNATLVLSLRGTKKGYCIQPQKQEHEVIIGRSDGSAMQPDIDLVDQGAGQLGVSRMHVAIQYNGKHNTVCISDMNSANGTYVNGQRLHPQEVRVLRHSDELRLGRMVFQVLFQQST